MLSYRVSTIKVVVVVVLFLLHGEWGGGGGGERELGGGMIKNVFRFYTALSVNSLMEGSCGKTETIQGMKIVFRAYSSIQASCGELRL